MSDILQFAAFILFPVGAFLFTLQFFGLIGALGFAVIIASGLLWTVGREMNINRQKAETEAYNREVMTGWSADEREDLERTQ